MLHTSQKNMPKGSKNSGGYDMPLIKGKIKNICSPKKRVDICYYTRQQSIIQKTLVCCFFWSWSWSDLSSYLQLHFCITYIFGFSTFLLKSVQQKIRFVCCTILIFQSSECPSFGIDSTNSDARSCQISLM